MARDRSVELEYRIDGEVGSAALLEHDERLDGAQRFRVAGRGPRRGQVAVSAATRLLSAGLLLYLAHY